MFGWADENSLTHSFTRLFCTALSRHRERRLLMSLFAFNFRKASMQNFPLSTKNDEFILAPSHRFFLCQSLSHSLTQSSQSRDKPSKATFWHCRKRPYLPRLATTCLTWRPMGIQIRQTFQFNLPIEFRSLFFLPTENQLYLNLSFSSQLDHFCCGIM